MVFYGILFRHRAMCSHTTRGNIQKNSCSGLHHKRLLTCVSGFLAGFFPGCRGFLWFGRGSLLRLERSVAELDRSRAVDTGLDRQRDVVRFLEVVNEADSWHECIGCERVAAKHAAHGICEDGAVGFEALCNKLDGKDFMVSLVWVCALSFVAGRVFRVEETFALVFLDVSGRVWRIAKHLDGAEQQLEFRVHAAQFVAEQHQFLH